ncbi:hypothetical protein A45J_2702 [hot springs metagenome]|uniref:Arc-like DNA binding domain-containing protein n=1 Tax=hot springs metagenome TaxID=433727 RepID=A0A5J4KYZ8_9ZZZZ
MQGKNHIKHISLRLPDELHKQIKNQAEAEQRSLHGQIIYLLSSSCAAHSRSVQRLVEDKGGFGRAKTASH